MKAAHLHIDKSRPRGAAQAHLMRLSHSLEKGMALPQPRKGFGSTIATMLLNDLESYCKKFGTDANACYCLRIVEATARFHSARSYDGEDWKIHHAKCLDLREKFNFDSAATEEVGIVSITKKQIVECAPIDPKAFFYTRRSVRQFSEQPVAKEEIRYAVELARRAPSVCNRQGARVYVYTDTEAKSRILSFQDGNAGFGETASVLFIVTSDLSIFYKSGERNQAFVDGGIFSMSLVLVLHSMGLGSCMLNWSMTPRQDSRLRNVLDIPQSEVIIALVVAGHLKDEFPVAASPRRLLDEVLIFNKPLKS